jgi:GT2 family glycosyltransferase
MRLARRRVRVGEQTEHRPEAPVRASRAEALLASSVFDAAYYAATVGVTFPDELAAARHCVRQGMPQSLSPSPLLEVGDLPRATQDAWRAGRVGVVLAFLRRAQRPVSPLFDAGRAPGTVAEKAAHPGGALGLFLDRADQDTPLPVPDSYASPPPTLGAARRSLVEHARATRAQAQLADPVPLTEWDDTAEERWKSRVMAAARDIREAPLVSVVAPVDGPEGAGRALGRLREQSWTRWELLVVLEAAAGAEALVELTEGEPRLRVLSRPAGTGLGGALDAGTRAARGTWLAFLGAHHTWRPDFLELGVSALVHGGLDAGVALTRVDGSTDGPGADGPGTDGPGSAGPGADAPAIGVLEQPATGRDELLAATGAALETLLVGVEPARDVGGFDPALRQAAALDFALRLASRTTVEPLPFVGADRARAPAHDPDDTGWLAVVGSHLVDWAALDAQAPHRDQGTVSVVIPTYGDWRMTTDAVAAVLEDAPLDGRDTPHRVEVVVVDNGSSAEVGRRLVARFLTEPRVRYLRLPRNLNFAIGCNAGFAATSGGTVVFLNNDTVARPGWLDAMLPHLADADVRGVQPLLLFADDTVQSAGTVFCDNRFLPVHLLAGHPVEDAERLARRPFSAVTAAAMAVRATEFAALRGFDPVFVNGMEDIDLCLRATQEYGGGFVVEPAAKVTHLESRTPGRNARVGANRRTLMQRWRGRLPGPELERYAELGLAVAHLASDGQPVSAARPVVVRPAADLTGPRPRLRWGVKSAAVPGPSGDASADGRLAGSLSAALSRLGQDVVTYRRGAHASPASYLDDVVLGIRGADPVVPHPGKLNVLWLPDLAEQVDPAELAGFDLVRTSSAQAARELSATSGRRVQVLLEAEEAGADLDAAARALVAAATSLLQGRAAAED